MTACPSFACPQAGRCVLVPLALRALRPTVGFVVPVLAVSGLVVLLAFDPSNWLLVLVVVLLLLASLIVVLRILWMLSDDGDATG